MFKWLYKVLREGHEKKVAYWQLHHMSDKTLKDIGLTRDDIYRKIYGS